MRYNGKEVTITKKTNYDAPHSFVIELSHAANIEVNLPMSNNQLDFFQHALEVGKKNAMFGNNDPYRYVREDINDNWDSWGNEDDALLLALISVGYDKKNLEDDLSTIEDKKEELADLMLNFIDSFNVEIKEAIDEEELIHLDIKARFAAINNKAGKIKDDIIQLRRNVSIFTKYLNDEKVGLGWNNDSFFEQYGDTEEAQIAWDIIANTL
jgi:hypothetical protein